MLQVYIYCNVLSWLHVEGLHHYCWCGYVVYLYLSQDGISNSILQLCMNLQGDWLPIGY